VDQAIEQPVRQPINQIAGKQHGAGLKGPDQLLHSCPVGKNDFGFQRPHHILVI